MTSPFFKIFIFVSLINTVSFIDSNAMVGQEKDSLRHALKLAPKDSNRVKILNELCRVYRSNAPDSAIRYGEQALELSHLLNYKKGNAAALNLLGVVFFFKGDYLKAESLQNEVIDYSLKNHISEQLSNAHNSLALSLQYQGNYTQAFDHYLQALKMEEGGRNNKGIVKVLGNMALLFKAMGDYDSSLKYSLKAYFINDSTNNSEQAKASLSTNIGLIYLEKGKYEDALKYCKVSLELNRKLNNKMNISSSLGNIGFCLLKMKDTRGAEPFVEEAYQWSKKIEAEETKVFALINLGMLRTQQKRYEEGITFLKEGLAISLRLKARKRVVEIYSELSEAYSLVGKYDDAYRFSRKALTLTDSLHAADLADKIASLQKSYELNKQRLTINTLSGEKKIKELENDRERNIIYFLFVIMLFLIIATALVFWGFKNKVRFSKELQVRYDEIQDQKETIESININLRAQALRVQMNPHFIFNSLTSIQYLIAHQDSESAFSYLSKFSMLLRKVLGNSDKLLISINEEIELLKLYIELESLRFDDNFDYEISEELNGRNRDDIFIPSLLIQPFVENAIHHGLLQKEGSRKLKILFKYDDGKMVCQITDNGIGRIAAMNLQSNTVENSRPHAISISESRIRVMNNLIGKNTHLDITDLYDAGGQPAGTQVTITQEL